MPYVQVKLIYIVLTYLVDHKGTCLMDKTGIEVIDLSRASHRFAVIDLLNDYMMDEMGSQKPFALELHDQVLSDLQNHPSYIGFLLVVDKVYVALANCFVNYSTFQAKHLLNIHDYIVSGGQRGNGYGKALLTEIIKYSSNEGYCRINLEVREDNVVARSLYKNLGFGECRPKMFFWERKLA